MHAPPAPPWGQQTVLRSPEITRRVTWDSGREEATAVVLGAGGALGPDVVHALQARGYGTVIGADVQLTYPVAGAVYRHLDLGDGDAVAAFLDDVGARGTLGAVIDLAAVQTNPRDGVRGGLGVGRAALADALANTEVPWVYMSTAEVYGAPEGAPYTEDHVQAPINPYGLCKQAEEHQVLAAHDAGLRVCALRCWTIAMVDTDGEGEVVATRNYNDPLIALAERLARAGVRIPVVEPEARCQFHLGEEVAQVLVWLAEQPGDSDVWGRAWNCPGKATTHAELAEACFRVFAAEAGATPWWAPAARVALGRRVPRRPLEAVGRVAEAVGAFGARELGTRLPFLYRSTDMDSAALSRRMGDALLEGGGDSTVAVRRLCQGIARGGPDQLSLRRYRTY